MTNDILGTPIQGYSRADVDQFLAAAAEERIRLEATIDDLQSRISRARSAIGMHRVMVAMLLETQRELTDIRDSAAAEAEQIVREAEAEAVALRASAPVPRASASSRPSSAITYDDGIDLTGEAPSPLSVGAVAGPSLAAPLAAEPHNDGYMEFLRGALSDDSPLGPVGE